MHLPFPVWVVLVFVLGVALQIYARWKHRWDETQETIIAKSVVEKEVRAEWGSDAALVLAELDLIKESLTKITDRESLQLTILQLSDHSLEDLKDWVRMANEDFRDVLDLAERRHSSEYRARALERFRQRKPELSSLFSKEFKEKVNKEWGTEAILVLLELKFIKESVTKLTDRESLQAKVLELSNHSMDDIKYWVQMANEDFREVLWLAEPGQPPMLITKKLEQFKQRKRKKLEAGQP